jgi:Lipase (class 3)
VGHSLGGAAAALLAIMLRNKSKEELGFPPEIVSAVGFGTPPCLSKEVAEKCADYVSTVVLQVSLDIKSVAQLYIYCFTFYCVCSVKST